MTIDDLASKKVAILGMGIEGVALATFLSGKCASLALLDRAPEDQILAKQPQSASILANEQIQKTFGSDYLSRLSDFDVVFRSPGIPFLTPQIQAALEAGVEISSQIKLFFQLSPAKIIGVTGTKGKGTTASLILDMLKNNMKNEKRAAYDHSQPNIYLAGNIGEPAVSLLPKLKENDWVILELSSFQLQDLDRSPQIAVVLNISSDHLDYHADIDEYRDAKLSIVKFQSKEDAAIINMDYLTSYTFSAATSARSYFFSGHNVIDDGAFVRKSGSLEEVVLNLNGELSVVCNNSEIKLVGHHNLENIAAAALAARLAGAEVASIRQAAMQFEGLPHRLEKIATIKGVEVYNDSFSTNPDPSIAAIKAFSNDKLLILGGSSKGASFDELAGIISASNVKSIALIGDESQAIKAALVASRYSGQIFEAEYDLKSAVDKLIGSSRPGDVLIFSPACASFDMFNNYKDRGDQFRSIVKQIESNQSS